METMVARLDAQMPPLRVEMTQLHNKADKIDADQRKTMVLFEDTDGKFKLVLDAYVGINQKMENIQETVNLLGQRVDQLEIRFDKLEVRLDNLEARMDKLEARMDRLETRMDKLEKDMKDGFDGISRKLDELIGGRGLGLQSAV